VLLCQGKRYDTVTAEYAWNGGNRFLL
jgi:hypothetical protein